jgi:hypothetical protein
MLKIVTLFLVFIAVLAMFGRLKLPKITMKRGHGLPRPSLCRTCKRYNLRGGPCPHCTEGRS